MTASLFDQLETAQFSWRNRDVVLPSAEEWRTQGGIPEAHALRAAALKSAQRYIADVLKELLAREQDALYLALFLESVEARTEKLKHNKYPAIVARYIKRHDCGRYNDSVRDYIAQIAGN